MSQGNRVVTFGCRLNIYESAVIQDHLDSSGLCDTIVVNSCAVTETAEQDLRRELRRLRKHHPDSRIVLTGCAAQIFPEKYAALEHVDSVIGNHEKLLASTYQHFLKDDSRASARQVQDIFSIQQDERHALTHLQGHTRGFLQVQNGCDHRCTFCVIPLGRGKSRSVPQEDVVRQAQDFWDRGHRELVLTGVDLTAYGRDLDPSRSLGSLVCALLDSLPSSLRLRLSSLDGAEMDQSLIDIFAQDERLMPHVHLSLQSGSDAILRRMGRRHKRSDALQLIKTLRALRPNMSFGADFMTGFPGETDAMFQDTVALVEEAQISWLHVFPYSERPGTKAETYAGHVPVQDRRARAYQLRQKGVIQAEQFLLSLKHQACSVLFEHDGIGYTEHYAPVICEQGSSGSVQKIIPVDVVDGRLVGVLEENFDGLV